MPRLLDLFCGAGGAAMGYHRAGFEVVGVDIAPQPRYPFEFHRADALTFPLEGFDVIHASPPCQAYSRSSNTRTRKDHPRLIVPTRERLQATGLPYVIENVPGAPLLDPLVLCGAALGLTATDDDAAPLVLRRHRLFESNVMLLGGAGCQCAWFRARDVMIGGVYGAGPQNRAKVAWHGNDGRRGGYTPKQHVRAQLMGIDWMSVRELTQAIPPAYTEVVGGLLFAALRFSAAA